MNLNLALVVLVASDRAGDNAMVGEKICDGGETLKTDGGKGGGFAVERACDLAAGRIAVRMQDAASAMCAFAGEEEVRAFTIKLRTPFDQFLDARRALFYKSVNGVAIAESRAGVQR